MLIIKSESPQNNQFLFSVGYYRDVAHVLDRSVTCKLAGMEEESTSGLCGLVEDSSFY